MSDLLLLSPFTEQETGSETVSTFLKITHQVSRNTQTKSIYAFPDCPYLRPSCPCTVKHTHTELFPEFLSAFPQGPGTDTQMPNLAKAHVLELPLQAWVAFWKPRQTIQSLVGDGDP